MNLGGFRCWVRYPVISRLCLITKETKKAVSITLFIIFDNVTKYKEQSDKSYYLGVYSTCSSRRSNQPVQVEGLSFLFAPKERNAICALWLHLPFRWGWLNNTSCVWFIIMLCIYKFVTTYMFNCHDTIALMVVCNL